MPRKQFRILLIVIVSLCVVTTLVPSVLLILTSKDPDRLEQQQTARKTLFIDSEQESEKIRNQISELERIKLSVRNELRELEKQRFKIVQETEEHKSILFKLQDQINGAKKQLQLTQAELAKVSHELYAVTRDHSPIIPLTQAPPIIILPQAPPTTSDTRPHPVGECSTNPSSCLNYDLCPLTKPFKVYLYQLEHHLLNEFTQYLQSIDALTSDPNEACLFVAIFNPLNGQQYASPDFMSRDWRQGTNHILVNIVNTTDTQSSHREFKFNPLKAVVVQSLPSQDWRHGHDILTPPITSSLERFAPPLVPAHRKILLHYEANFKNEDNGDYVIWLQTLAKTLGINETVYIETSCHAPSKSGGVADGLSLCGNRDTRSHLLTQSTFTLVLATTSQTSLSNQLRVSEALQYGAIPVVAGHMEMPYDIVLDWSQVSIQLPIGRLHELHYIVRSLSHDKILEMRRLGRFYWETYFSAPLQILKSVLAIMRYRLLHPPPVAKCHKNYRSKLYSKTTPVTSVSSSNSTSVYSYEFWNRPPGPFFITPQTPNQPSPISGSHYAEMDLNELKKLPPHIVQAGGITGPYFENYLLGNIPDEYFTVVILTYRREDVIKESIERLQSLSYLAKVIVVWNDPDTSPFNLDWPKLTVPLEVGKKASNSCFVCLLLFYMYTYTVILFM